MVLGVGPQILYVHIRQARDEKLQFLFVKDCNQSLRYDVIEAFKESIDPGEKFQQLLQFQLTGK